MLALDWRACGRFRHRSEQVGTFKPEPKRWVIESTFAWLGRNRRLAKDFEATIASAEAWFLIAHVTSSRAGVKA